MRRRLRATYLTLLVAVLIGLDVPLAFTLASRTAQTMFIDRLNDTGRIASLAEPALRTGRLASLEAELRQYDEVFGIAVTVVGRDGLPVLASRAGLDMTVPAIQEPLGAALSGQHAALPRTIWPWHDEPLVVATPVARDGEVIGAVLTVSPTAVLRADTGRALVMLLAVSGVVLLAGATAANPLARWMLRSVTRLDAAAAALSEGRYDTRVDSASGPEELRRLASSFNEMADRITVLISRQQSFVSYASHQLRTPLATLWLCAENLGPAVQPHGSDDYQMMTEEIVRLGQLCDSLLAYARAEVTASDGEPIDAAAVVSRRIAAWRGLAERAEVRLTQAGAEQAAVRVSAQALDQALDALLSNAVKFAGPGASVVVTVGEPDEGGVDIDVVDDGPGIPSDDLPRMTEAFWRGPGSPQVDGSGLGLAIAAALVTASNGQFEVSAAVPHGVRARIRLPAAAATAPHSGGAGRTTGPDPSGG